MKTFVLAAVLLLLVTTFLFRDLIQSRIDIWKRKHALSNSLSSTQQKKIERSEADMNFKKRSNINKPINPLLNSENTIEFSSNDIRILHDSLSKKVLLTIEERKLFKKLEFTLQHMRLMDAIGKDEVLFEVRYCSPLGWIDNLKNGEIYPVIKTEDKGRYYIIINHDFERVRVHRSKFDIVKN